MQTTVQVAHLVRQARHWAIHPGVRYNIPDGQCPHGRRRNVHLGKPLGELFRRTDIDDSPQTDPTMRRRTHWTMLSRCVDRRRGPLRRSHVLRGPARQRELRMLCGIPRGNAIAVLGEHTPVSAHQHRTEWLIPCIQRVARQLHATTQIRHFGITDHGLAPT